MADLNLAQAASARLTKTAVRIASNKLTVADMAVSAFVQNIASQAAIQALVNLIKSKNLVSTAEIDRALAQAYDDAEREAARQGLIAVPTSAAIAKT